MNDDPSGWFLVIVFVWVFTAVSIEPIISPESVKYAEKICKDNDGWKYIEEGYSIFSTIKCNNGAEFEYDWTMFDTEAYKKDNE